ncbi:MAG: NAD(P)(+) transhydrogenase (Re/Si-specific) subunit beta [Gammaproteobacteria bacterium]|nr:NAD(P)(+) transhydrogenase (Re/Si-specific) subunit beta [Gammaproteobacteria bacterium]MDX2487552.1 NAD(P)(+) transhydrogenase (Re/Si-specific) subunit beta [Gammaproteobacteria bacterium]
MLNANTLAIIYLISASLFILGLKGLTHPSTARRGNYLAMTGMLLAIVATLFNPVVQNYSLILAGLAIGAVIGIMIAIKIDMKAMPQLVAAFHSLVGLTAVLVAIGTFTEHAASGQIDGVMLVELGIGSFIGAITFTGSLIAFGKLQGVLSGNPIVFKGQHLLNLALGLLTLALVFQFSQSGSLTTLLLITAIALALGFLLIIPIGGADMPVVVSMLNSYSGWAAAATGFTLQNNALIVTGALVGFSGAILSFIMCRAMNRSFISVILGGFGGSDDEESTAMQAANQGIKSAAVEDLAFMIENANRLIVVPGYGMAVAQAQHALKELTDLLDDKGIEVKFAIHPVAGRMPGHMNVLLAESDIPYDHVIEMDEINPEFSTTDVALVVGANDVTNPAAKTDKSSPIYGMPILDVEKAKYVFVIKRSMRPGYSGIENLLYFRDNCSMVFGDAKEVCESLVQELKNSM